MDPEISIVVPMNNEAPNVLRLTQQVFAAMGQESRPCELILVDDGSTDDTWDKMLTAQASDGRVRLLRHPRSAGQSAAMWTGFRASRGRIIATLDGDLQNDPADIPRMLSELEACDMVCGVRTNRQDTMVRRLSSRIARAARKMLLKSEFRDTGCCLRVFRRHVLQSVPAFNGFHRFMPILVWGGGGNVREMAVRHHPRTAGISKYGVWNRLGRGLVDLVMVKLFLRRQLKLMKANEHVPKRTAAAAAPGEKTGASAP